MLLWHKMDFGINSALHRDLIKSGPSQGDAAPWRVFVKSLAAASCNSCCQVIVDWLRQESKPKPGTWHDEIKACTKKEKNLTGCLSILVWKHTQRNSYLEAGLYLFLCPLWQRINNSKECGQLLFASINKGLLLPCWAFSVYRENNSWRVAIFDGKNKNPLKNAPIICFVFLFSSIFSHVTGIVQPSKDLLQFVEPSCQLVITASGLVSCSCFWGCNYFPESHSLTTCVWRI